MTDFVSRFMPAYETYLPFLYKFGPQRRRLCGYNSSMQEFVPILKMTIGFDRCPITELHNLTASLKSKL